MTVRGEGPNDNHVIRLSGWKLVAALALMTVVILGALWLTGEVKSAMMVTVPLLVALGAISIRSRE